MLNKELYKGKDNIKVKILIIITSMGIPVYFKTLLQEHTNVICEHPPITHNLFLMISQVI